MFISFSFPNLVIVEIHKIVNKNVNAYLFNNYAYDLHPHNSAPYNRRGQRGCTYTSE